MGDGRRLDPDLVADLLDEASSIAEGDREAWLAARCDGDRELEDEVRELLEHLPDPESTDGLDDADGPTGPGEGSIVGGCRLGRELGRGGMGVVHEAEQLEPRRPVAVKTLRADFLGPDARRRMRLEAAALARIDHPAVAKVLAAGLHRDPGTGETVPYLVLELVPGARSLSEWWRDADLPLDRKLERFAEVCDGVHQAHLRGILHRDLKAANVLVGPDGQPKVIDFGVAALAEPGDDDASLAATGHALVGTLASMSPEQAAGRPVDHRSDVYALGTMLYQLLAGEPPYRVDRNDLPGSIRRIAESIPSPPSRRDPRCRGDLDVIVATALAKDPAERYDSAAGLADDLRRTLADEPILARPTPLPHRVAKAIRRNLAVTLASTAAILALVTALVASLVGQARTSRALFAASFANLERMAESGEVRSARKAFEDLASFGLGEPWAAAVHRGEIDQATGSCEVEPPMNSMAMALSSDGSLAAMSGPTDRVRLVDVATMAKVLDLELGKDECYGLEFRDGDRTLRLVRLSGAIEDWSIPPRGGDGTVRPVFDFGSAAAGEYLSEASTSPDGRWLCGGINGPRGRHELVDLETGRRFSFAGLDRVDVNMAFIVAPHPTRPLFACSGDAGLCLLDASGDEPRWIPTSFRSQSNDLRFSPDGRTLAAITLFGAYRAAVPDDPAEGLELEMVPFEARVQSPWSLAWSPDSRTLAASGRTPEIVLLDPATGAVRGRRFGGSGYHWRMGFTPDGESIVVAAGGLVKFPVREAFPRELRPAMIGMVPGKPSVAWIEDGTLLVATGPRGELDILEPASGVSTRLVAGTAESLGCGDVDPTRERIVVGGVGRATLLIERRTGRTVELPPIGRADFAFSPSGAWLLYTDSDRRYRVVDVPRGEIAATLDIPLAIDSLGSLWLDDRRCVTGGSNARALVELDATGRWSVRPIPSRGLAVIAPIPPGPDGLAYATCTLGPYLHGMHGYDPLVEGDAPKVELANLTETPRVIAGSPDGALIAAGGSDPRVMIYDRHRRLALGSFPVAARITDLEFSPDSRTLAAIDHKGRILLFDTRTGPEREAIRRRRLEQFGLPGRDFRKSLESLGVIGEAIVPIANARFGFSSSGSRP